MSPIKNVPVRKQRSNLKIVGRLEKLFRLYTNTALHCITHYDTCDSSLFSNKHTHTHKHIHTYVFVMFTKHAKLRSFVDNGKPFYYFIGSFSLLFGFPDSNGLPYCYSIVLYRLFSYRFYTEDFSETV